MKCVNLLNRTPAFLQWVKQNIQFVFYFGCREAADYSNRVFKLDASIAGHLDLSIYRHVVIDSKIHCSNSFSQKSRTLRPSGGYVRRKNLLKIFMLITRLSFIEIGETYRLRAITKASTFFFLFFVADHLTYTHIIQHVTLTVVTNKQHWKLVR